MRLLRTAGFTWIAVVAVVVVMFVFRDPAQLNGPAASEYVFPPQLFGGALALPGLAMIPMGRARNRHD